MGLLTQACDDFVAAAAAAIDSAHALRGRRHMSGDGRMTCSASKWAGLRERLESTVVEPSRRDQELSDLIDGDPVIRMYFTRMIGEVPRRAKLRRTDP